jgi:cysteine synthase
MESFNPVSSVKDRLALALIEDAERSGALKPGQTVVEATSGNTGIALAMVCAAKGYPLVITMAETFSIERRKLMRMMGATVILTPAAQRGSGMVKKAAELAEKHGWFRPLQFDNEAGPAYHRNTTATEVCLVPEVRTQHTQLCPPLLPTLPRLQILSDFAGKRLDYFVSGWGTGGTIVGVGQMMKVARPEVAIIASEPEGAQLLAGKPFTPHKVQGKLQRNQGQCAHTPVFLLAFDHSRAPAGWTPDFVPSVLERGRSCIDRIVPVNDDASIAASRALAQKEGILCGISCGATFEAALQVAKDAPKGSVILAMLPDTGERYLSTALFAGINEGTDPEPEL